jgi:hypothetical protein
LFKPLIIKAINEAKEDRENIQEITNKRQKT